MLRLQNGKKDSEKANLQNDILRYKKTINKTKLGLQSELEQLKADRQKNDKYCESLVSECEKLQEEGNHLKKDKEKLQHEIFKKFKKTETPQKAFEENIELKADKRVREIGYKYLQLEKEKIQSELQSEIKKLKDEKNDIINETKILRYLRYQETFDKMGEMIRPITMMKFELPKPEIIKAEPTEDQEYQEFLTPSESKVFKEECKFIANKEVKNNKEIVKNRDNIILEETEDSAKESSQDNSV